MKIRNPWKVLMIEYTVDDRIRNFRNCYSFEVSTWVGVESVQLNASSDRIVIRGCLCIYEKFKLKFKNVCRYEMYDFLYNLF